MKKIICWMFIIFIATAVVNGKKITKPSAKLLIDEINMIQERDGHVEVNEIEWEAKETA